MLEQTSMLAEIVVCTACFSLPRVALKQAQGAGAEHTGPLGSVEFGTVEVLDSGLMVGQASREEWHAQACFAQAEGSLAQHNHVQATLVS